MKWIPLHNHTEYSLLDSPAPPKAYAALAAERGMTHVAITDHGSLSGVLKFSNECALAGVKPILGCEFYLREGLVEDKKRDHLLVLARDKEGWRQLLALNKQAQRDGWFYYRPRITVDALAESCSHLVVSSACIFSPFMDFCKANDVAGAERLAARLREATGGKFYLELIFNALAEQVTYNAFVEDLSGRTGIPLIVTNDIHYARREDAILRELMWAIMYKKAVWQLDLENMNDDMYFKTPEEIWQTAQQHGYTISRSAFEAACERTLEVAGLVEDFDIRLGRYAIPSFCKTPKDAHDAVTKICYEAVKKVKPARRHTYEEYEDRLIKELEVIGAKEFSNYFLIMRDIVEFCAREGIYVGVGRGSVVGSLVAYLLGITRLDPIAHGLMFERFLSRARKEPPDIDMDFEAGRRDEVEDYIRKKYGDENVAHVFTFGTFGTKGVIRDIGRVFGLDQDKVDRMAKEFKEDADVLAEVDKFREAHKYEPGTVEFVNSNAAVWNLAGRIKGRLRHYSMHASGVVIDDNGLRDVPMLRVKDKLVCALQEGADEREISELGLIKFDILGLTACGTIREAAALVRETRGAEIESELDHLDLSTAKAADIYKHFNEGDTAGVFQFSSPGIRDFMMRVGVQRFDDLVAINALYRPANLVSGEAEEYILRKKGEVPVTYVDERLEPILHSTYGCIVYQEQILQLLHAIGQLTLEEADEIRSLFKKHYALGDAEANNVTRAKMADFKARVTEKWKENGLDDAKSEHLFNLINHYTKYAFNKSHAAAYAYIAFQMMWLKHNYPAEFHVAALNHEIGNDDKVVELMRSARGRRRWRYDIKVYGPKLNASGEMYRLEKVDVEGKSYAIREGYIGIEGVGERAAHEIFAATPAADFADFMARVNKRVVNKRVVATMIRSGVFDGIAGTPAPENSGVLRPGNGV